MSRERLLGIEQELCTRYVERDEIIHGLMLAALSGQHIVLLGPPGNAKSMLIKDFTEYVTGASHFGWLMTQFTTPDEVFGPVDMAEYKAGVFKRITTHKLPEAHVAFLDEVFKANSAILNSMLSILQERRYHNNGTPMACPLLFCVGASNELPAEDEGLAALYDRFLIRYSTGYLSDEHRFEQLMQLHQGERIATAISYDELVADSQAAKVLPVSQEAVESITIIWKRLREESIIVSDRRYKQTLQVAAAESWMQGYSQVEADSLLIAEHTLWDKPDQRRTVSQVVRSSINPTAAKVAEIKQAATEAIASIDSYADVGAIVQVIKQLRHSKDELAALRDSSTKTQALAWVSQQDSELTLKVLGDKP